MGKSMLCKKQQSFGSLPMHRRWIGGQMPGKRASSDFKCRGGSQESGSRLGSTAVPSTKNASEGRDTPPPTSAAKGGSNEQNDYTKIVGQLKSSQFGEIPYLSTADVATSGQHRVLFVLGGPGSGKGTQSERIVDQYKCLHLSVGDLLRQERQKEGSKHAKLIEDLLVAGKIVPVELSLGLLAEAMDEAAKEDGGLGASIFLVDGFPRNYDNLDGWTKLMPSRACVFGSLVYDCPMKELERRILSRGETSGRSDDNLESARKRFRTYEKETVPVVKVLDKQGGASRVIHIAGDRPIEKVWEDTRETMDYFVLNDVLTSNQRLLDSVSKLDMPTYLSLVDGDMLSAGYREHQSGVSDLSIENQQNLVFSMELGETDPTNRSSKYCNIANVDIAVSGGVNAVISYDRQMYTDGAMQMFRETRVWQHQKKGWVNIHFVRSFLSSTPQEPPE
jgi:UMP-CMP kinase